MTKRPLDERFGDAVLDERKFTTIRDRPWPVGVPIMLYHWTGKPYRSKHRDCAAVVVLGFWTIEIAHMEDGTMHYRYGMENAKPLYETEGFESREEMDDWFRPLVKRGHSVTKYLMRFRLLKNTVEI